MKQETDHSWLIIKALEDRVEQAEAKLREIDQLARKHVMGPDDSTRLAYYEGLLRETGKIARSTSHGGEG